MSPGISRVPNTVENELLRGQCLPKPTIATILREPLLGNTATLAIFRRYSRKVFISGAEGFEPPDVRVRAGSLSRLATPQQK